MYAHIESGDMMPIHSAGGLGSLSRQASEAAAAESRGCAKTHVSEARHRAPASVELFQTWATRQKKQCGDSALRAE